MLHEGEGDSLMIIWQRGAYQRGMTIRMADDKSLFVLKTKRGVLVRARPVEFAVVTAAKQKQVEHSIQLDIAASYTR